MEDKQKASSTLQGGCHPLNLALCWSTLRRNKEIDWTPSVSNQFDFGAKLYSQMSSKEGVRVHLSNRWQSEVQSFREAAQYSLQNGTSESVEVFQRSYSWNYYWTRKSIDSTFHPDTWGGLRGTKFSKEETMVIWLILWSTCMARPTSRIAE